jgi:hypothetical protein
MSDLWDEFVDFAYSKKLEHKLLFPEDLEKETLDQMLTFHFHNKNLYLAKNGDEWSFAVLRPVKHALDVVFNWEQPESDILLLDYLYSKCKKSTLLMWNMFCERNMKPSAIVYYRRGKPKLATKELMFNFFKQCIPKSV